MIENDDTGFATFVMNNTKKYFPKTAENEAAFRQVSEGLQKGIFKGPYEEFRHQLRHNLSLNVNDYDAEFDEKSKENGFSGLGE